jgi:hypothetical protein
MSRFSYWLFAPIVAACSHLSSNGAAPVAGRWQLKDPPHSMPKDPKSPRFGGFSGLCCSAKTRDSIHFVSLSDRGPNLDPYPTKAKEPPKRPFIEPGFVPEMMVTSWSPKGGWTLVERVPLHWENNVAATGLPNNGAEERPVSADGRELPYDARGLDPEGIALAEDGGFWIVEEYGPSLLKVSPQGRILKRWIPKGSGASRHGIEALPAELAQRALNRGFEGVALVGKTLYAFLQSPFKGQSTVKVLVWDTEREISLGIKEYPMHDPAAQKIGDATTLPDGRLLVLEQDGGTDERALRKVFAWDPTSGSKSLVLDLTAAGYTGLEKAEGISMIDHEHLAVVADNDYGLVKQAPSELVIFKVRVPGN